MTLRRTFILFAITLLPLALFLTSCEKLRNQINAEMRRGKPEKIRVSTCCWCVEANTYNNAISNYIGPKYCEQMVKDSTKSYSSCKKVQVDSDRCSFNRVSNNASETKIRRTGNDLRIHGTEEFITALTPQPTHCDRRLTSTGLEDSNDPRCSAETCKCFADPNLPWNCELVLLRKDGKKESLGVRSKLEREHGCDATACRQLFAREVHAFCPSFN